MPPKKEITVEDAKELSEALMVGNNNIGQVIQIDGWDEIEKALGLFDPTKLSIRCSSCKKWVSLTANSHEFLCQKCYDKIGSTELGEILYGKTS